MLTDKGGYKIIFLKCLLPGVCKHCVLFLTLRPLKNDITKSIIEKSGLQSAAVQNYVLEN